MESDGQSDVLTVAKKKLKRPTLYKVLLHNDDYTTMDFVIHILKKFFHKSPSQAQEIMLRVHKEGAGVCGVYTREIAETKVSFVTEEAQKSSYPLLCTYEPE